MTEPALLYEKEGHVATLTMNRPEVRNALNAEMLCRLADAWQDVNDDPQIRVAILTGAVAAGVLVLALDGRPAGALGFPIARSAATRVAISSRASCCSTFKRFAADASTIRAVSACSF